MDRILVLVRHGQSEWNLKNLFTGWRDVGLTDKGIAEAKAGNRVGDISHAIQSHVERHGYSVVRSLVGHGIGRAMHEEPQVPNYGQPDRGPRLMAGQVLAIEPMVNVGGSDVVTRADGWTVVTKDGSLSAHFEHTVAVGAEGSEILSEP